MGEGSGGGSGQTFCRQSRVGSRFYRVGSKKSDPWTTLTKQTKNVKNIHKLNKIKNRKIKITNNNKYCHEVG